MKDGTSLLSSLGLGKVSWLNCYTIRNFAGMIIFKRLLMSQTSDIHNNMA